MVKTGKKDFVSGLNELIQSTVVKDETEELTEVENVDTVKEPKQQKAQTRKKVEKEKQITITIPPSLKKTIKKYCANNDITIKELFINSVTEYMKAQN